VCETSSVCALMASRNAVVNRDSAGVAESARDTTMNARVEEVAATEKRDAAGGTLLEKQPYTIKVLEKGKPPPSASDQAMELLRQHASASEKAKERGSAGAAKRKREAAGEEEAEEELLEQCSRASLCCFIPCPMCLSWLIECVGMCLTCHMPCGIRQHTSAYVRACGLWRVTCVNACAHMPHAMSHVIDLFN
jgi:hypothetical protein